MQDDVHDLTTLRGLREAIGGMVPGDYVDPLRTVDGTFCPRCGGIRRMELVTFYWWSSWPEMFDLGGDVEAGAMRPSLFAANCLQCRHLYVLLVHSGPQGLELAALPESYGGLATPNTPTATAYYLDQAHRARSVGALSAAAAMYRAALDQLLFDQGHTHGTLGKKLRDLEQADPQPAWYAELGGDHLDIIKQIGDGAIHPNDGDVERQKVIDGALSRALDALFAKLLDVIYERPAADLAQLEMAREAARALGREVDGRETAAD